MSTHGPRRRGRAREIETLEELDVVAARSLAGDRTMAGWQVQDLDLRDRTEALLPLDPKGALFLGCDLAVALEEHLRAGGALVFPEVPDVPFDPWRAHLYSPADLFADLDAGYAATPDARIYAWSQQATSDGSLKDLLAAALHDSSVDDALTEVLVGRDVVGVMGGHALERDDPAYADAARLGRTLAASGLTVATGGGPGAMEAANLGARLSEEDPSVLEDVLALVARVPGFHDDVTAWARVALAAVADLGDSGRSLGIPTWHYGHEPPNPFASSVAKYFRNAIREDVLLEVCRSGLVFLPGAAGTLQEVFQAACGSYYAAADDVVPMVFVGREQWTSALPAWPLLERLAADRPLAQHLHLVDDVAEVAGVLAGR